MLVRKPEMLVGIALANTLLTYASMCCRAADGPVDLGDVDEGRGLQGTGVGSCDMIIMA